MDKKHLNRLVQEALEGDKASLEKLIVEIQGYVYNLAVLLLEPTGCPRCYTGDPGQDHYQPIKI